MAGNTALVLNDRAEAASRALPPLLVEAERIAATVILGVHGRKRAGPGESFWQYRPYSFGDSTQRIDWHKSARSDRVFIRENEWEAANTLWLWVKPSASMDFKSHLAATSKRERAQLAAMALAALSLRAQERVAAIGSPHAPGHSRLALQRLANWFLAPGGSALPDARRLPRFSSTVLFGDFLDEPSQISAAVKSIAAGGVGGHLVQVVDPAEETLPYAGRVEYRDVIGDGRFLAARSEALRDAYIVKFRQQRDAVRDIAARLGWSFTVHRTDESVSRLLMVLHGLVGGAKSRAFGIGGMA